MYVSQHHHNAFTHPCPHSCACAHTHTHKHVLVSYYIHSKCLLNMGTVDAHRKTHSIHAGVSHLSHVEMGERGEQTKQI